MTAPIVSVIIPTHSPNQGRLKRTLQALGQQSYPAERWELLLVDNASPVPIPAMLAALGHSAGRIVSEPRLGLTHARLAGIATARGRILVFVDDDNLLHPEYLAEAVRLLDEHPEVAAAGGVIEGEFEMTPPVWLKENLWSLAVRNYGDRLLISGCSREGEARDWPVFSPIGAGMVVRTEAAKRYAAHCARSAAAMTDRRGQNLGSAGDCELVMHAAFLPGGQVAYSPALRLTHLIPLVRLGFRYHVRLAYQGGVTWGRFLAAYAFQPRIARISLLVRLPRAFWRRAGWTRRGFVAFCAAAGEFVGRTYSA
jgi:glycosyltransferase involved in cell wall biosynthesis